MGTGVSVAYGGRSAGGSSKLYQDQQQAQCRRANVEKGLLLPFVELQETKVKRFNNVEAGTGFKQGTSKSLYAKELANVLQNEGVIRLNGALGDETCDKCRELILREISESHVAVALGEQNAREILNMEPERKNRTDYQLSLTKGSSTGTYPVVTALSELFGVNGALRELYDVLVGNEGVLYELAAMTTERGADRQMIHTDFKFQREPPLYSIFVALQDVSYEMGPTVFLPGTCNVKDNEKWKDKSTFDDYLRAKTPHLALLKKGDLIVYDPRTLHCGAENDVENGSTRCMFNVGFRNVKAQGNFEYKGSLRSGYNDKIRYKEFKQLLDMLGKGKTNDPFGLYGNGLLTNSL